MRLKSTFPSGGACAIEEQHKMRLQGGPLHVGWRCREHLVYVRATLRRGRRCARNSQSKTGRYSNVVHPFCITLLLEFEVCRSIEVYSGSPSCENSNQGCD